MTAANPAAGSRAAVAGATALSAVVSKAKTPETMSAAKMKISIIFFIVTSCFDFVPIPEATLHLFYVYALRLCFKKAVGFCS
jgi:hypothetical protein